MPEGQLATTLISKLLGACGLPQIAKRLTKLYGVYEYILSVKKVEGAIPRELIISLLSALEVFNTFPASFPVSLTTIEKIAARAYREVKRDVFIRDLRRFQEKLPLIIKTYQEWFFQEFPGLSNKPSSLAFLPGFIIFARSFDRSLEAIRSPEALEEGLVAYYISLGKALPDTHLRESLGDAVVVKSFVTRLCEDFKSYQKKPFNFSPPVIKEMK